MTTARPWERVCRVLLCLFLCFIVTHALFAFNSDGFDISTGLSDMVPANDITEVQQLALKSAQESAEQSIVLLLESPHTTSLQAAVELVNKELATMSDTLHQQDSEEILSLISTDLKNYRFQLLSQVDRDVLRDEDYDSILDRSIADLYSPGSGLKLLPLSQDPFGLFSRYVEGGIGQLLVPSRADESADSAVENSDSSSALSMVYEIINLRLLTSMSELGDQALVVEFFNHLEDVVKTRYPEVNVLQTGVLFYSSEAASAARSDINMISIGSIVGASALMLLVFSSVRPLLTAAASIVVGVGFAFSVVHLLYGSIHVFTIVFGASLIGIVIDYSIHYYYHCAATGAARSVDQGDVSLPRKTDNGQLYRALLVSLLTSTAGFGALLFSNVIILQTIAVFSICGITAAWLTVLALSPEKTIGIVQVRQQLIDSIADTLSKAGACVVDRLNGRLALVGLACLLAAVIGLGKGQDDPRRFVNLSADLLQQGARISSMTNDLEPGRFFIVEASNEQQLFDRLEVLYTRTGDLAQLVSVFDWLPSPEDQQQNYQLQLSLFEESGAVSNFFEATGLAKENLTALQLEFQQSSNKLLTAEGLFDLLAGQAPAMVVSTKDEGESTGSLAAYVLIASGANIDKVKRAVVDVAGINYIDTVGDSTTQLRKQRISSMWLLVLAYLVVGILMWGLYRDRRAWVMIAVPAVSTILTLGVLLLLGQPLTLFHTMSLFLILGLGMDYVVFLNEMASDQKTTRQAIVLSALTSMLSFGLLALSSVPVAQAFGVTVLIGNTFNLLATLAISDNAIWQRKEGLTQ